MNKTIISEEAQEELRKNNIKITSLPGANAVVTLLSQLSRDNLGIGARLGGTGLAVDLVDAFLAAEYINGGNHVTRVKMISDIENGSFENK